MSQRFLRNLTQALSKISKKEAGKWYFQVFHVMDFEGKPFCQSKDLNQGAVHKLDNYLLGQTWEIAKIGVHESNISETRLMQDK